MFKKFLLIFLASAPYLMAQNQAYIQRRGDQVVLGNKYLERVISISPKNVGTTEIVNKLSGTTYNVKDDVFALQVVFSGLGPAPKEEQNGENDIILTARDFQFDGYKLSDLDGGGKELSLNFKFDWEMTKFQLKVNYEVYPARFSMRKWIELSDSSYGIQFLDRIYVESMTLDNADFSHGQFGQPVFDNDIFMGVEYPTVENEISGKSIRIGYVVGREIKKEPFLSHKSIIGSSPSRIKLHETFMDYVDGIKVNGTRPYLLFNSWYDLRNPAITSDSTGIMNEKNVLNTVEVFKKDLYDKYDISLDGFVLDDGWDNYKSLWGIDSTRFPNGFTPITDSLATMHTRLGLWASPFGGYSNRDIRVDWGAAHGYETTGDFYCLAGTRYNAAFKQKMDEYAEKYKLGYFKWDGFLLSCNDPDHGHLPGIYSREENVSDYIDVMKSVRKINPDIFLNITSGTWLSPWWLKYANCIWMQGEDYGYQESVPSLNDRDKAITYKDVILWDNFRKMHLLFPMSSLMTHGIIKGRFNQLGGANESLSSFSDEVMMYFGRGVTMWELYVSPDLLSAGEWNAIASSIKWAKANGGVLKNTRMILGDPLKGEVYGYVHLTNSKGIILLRNPSVASRSVKIKLTPDLGDIDPNIRYYVKMIYPYNFIFPRPVKMDGELSMNLDGYEVLTAELIPENDINKSLPVGVRYSVRDGQLFVFGKRGEEERIESVGNKNLGVVEFAKATKKLAWKVEPLAAKGNTKFSANLRIDVPQDYKSATFAFLLESDLKLQDQSRPAFTVKVNGAPKTASVEEGDGSWFWVSTPLDSGENSVSCSIRFNGKERGRVSLWIVGKQELAPRLVKGIAIGDEEIVPAKPYPSTIRKEIIPISHYTLQ